MNETMGTILAGFLLLMGVICMIFLGIGLYRYWQKRPWL